MSQVAQWTVMAAGRAATRRTRLAWPVGAEVKNAILATLLGTECTRMLQKLEHAATKRGEIVHRADQKVEYVYFPEEAVVAIADTTQARRTVEVGIIGTKESRASTSFWVRWIARRT